MWQKYLPIQTVVLKWHILCRTARQTFQIHLGAFPFSFFHVRNYKGGHKTREYISKTICLYQAKSKVTNVVTKSHVVAVIKHEYKYTNLHVPLEIPGELNRHLREIVTSITEWSPISGIENINPAKLKALTLSRYNIINQNTS